ncbi:hypothetical protein JB92DRAFT_3166460 [Gautieria morchelliformis]|nr:hypothetical protein JB92DRAFT_3166460 [Gautieria morchelliformis]
MEAYDTMACDAKQLQPNSCHSILFFYTSVLTNPMQSQVLGVNVSFSPLTTSPLLLASTLVLAPPPPRSTYLPPSLYGYHLPTTAPIQLISHRPAPSIRAQRYRYVAAIFAGLLRLGIAIHREIYADYGRLSHSTRVFLNNGCNEECTINVVRYRTARGRLLCHFGGPGRTKIFPAGVGWQHDRFSPGRLTLKPEGGKLDRSIAVQI